MSSNGKYPITPDGRYFVVRGRLWRMTNPALGPQVKSKLISDLMTARRAVGAALRAKDQVTEAKARSGVDLAKRALGERGDVWWDDGSPDYNRQMVKVTPYGNWFTLVASNPIRQG